MADAAEKVTDEAATAEPVGGVSKELSDEINGAVTETIEQAQLERDQREASASGKAKDLPPDEVQAGDAAGGDTPPDGEKVDEAAGKAGDSPAITDALVERAVKAGMTISDARTFQKADALERMCGMLEKRTEGAGKTKDEAAVVVDPLAAIPDLDPGEYDEKVVAGFKAMKDIIRGLQQSNAEIRGEDKSRQVSWLDGQVAALGKDFVEAVGTEDRAKLDPTGPQAVKRAALQAKVDVLTAGYKAAGQDMSRDAVFSEAVSIVLGDVKAKAASTVTTEKLGKRSGQHVARPSGSVRKPTTDACADVAATLDSKYFGKK